jgi:CheY-like chemotaxis protein
MNTDAGPPLVLLAEDDVVSRAFLTAAIGACGVTVQAFAAGPPALEFAQTHRCSVLILDQNLPGLAGSAILARLDAAARAAGIDRAPALALTADADDTTRRLLAAGFAEVLPKPIGGAALHAALERHCKLPATTLDDAAALAACGSADVGRRLRRLFLDQELPAVIAEFERCGSNGSRLRPTLHRLRAACGFCGATGLADAAAALHLAIATGKPTGAAAASFRAEINRTLAALRAKLDPT